jgi:hypothetical protein
MDLLGGYGSGSGSDSENEAQATVRPAIVNAAPQSLSVVHHSPMPGNHGEQQGGEEEEPPAIPRLVAPAAPLVRCEHPGLSAVTQISCM